MIRSFIELSWVYHNCGCAWIKIYLKIQIGLPAMYSHILLLLFLYPSSILGSLSFQIFRVNNYNCSTLQRTNVIFTINNFITQQYIHLKYQQQKNNVTWLMVKYFSLKIFHKDNKLHTEYMQLRYQTLLFLQLT